MNRWSTSPVHQMDAMWPGKAEPSNGNAVRKRVIGVIRGGAAAPYQRGRGTGRAGYFGRFDDGGEPRASAGRSTRSRGR